MGKDQIDSSSKKDDKKPEEVENKKVQKDDQG